MDGSERYLGGKGKRFGARLDLCSTEQEGIQVTSRSDGGWLVITCRDGKCVCWGCQMNGGVTEG